MTNRLGHLVGRGQLRAIRQVEELLRGTQDAQDSIRRFREVVDSRALAVGEQMAQLDRALAMRYVDETRWSAAEVLQDFDGRMATVQRAMSGGAVGELQKDWQRVEEPRVLMGLLVAGYRESARGARNSPGRDFRSTRRGVIYNY